VLGPGEENQKLTLTSRDQAKAVAAMQATTGRPENGDRPARAPAGVRWSDVPTAVGEACSDEGVEMTVIRTTAYDAQGVELKWSQRGGEPHEYVFTLRTVENWPGTLVIRQAPGAEVYEVAEASIGRFPDDPKRIERAEKLVKAFKRHLKRLGDQAWFND
jgi:hypothetical protein